jgi:hypothetical protein
MTEFVNKQGHVVTQIDGVQSTEMYNCVVENYWRRVLFNIDYFASVKGYSVPQNGMSQHNDINTTMSYIDMSMPNCFPLKLYSRIFRSEDTLTWATEVGGHLIMVTLYTGFSVSNNGSKYEIVLSHYLLCTQSRLNKTNNLWGKEGRRRSEMNKYCGWKSWDFGQKWPRITSRADDSTEY